MPASAASPLVSGQCLPLLSVGRDGAPSRSTAPPPPQSAGDARGTSRPGGPERARTRVLSVEGGLVCLERLPIGSADGEVRVSSVAAGIASS